MKTIQEALKAVFYSLGGNAAAVEGTDDEIAILKAIAALDLGAALAGKSTLPAVDSGDKGKVLTVSNDGEWEAAALPE